MLQVLIITENGTETVLKQITLSAVDTVEICQLEGSQGICKQWSVVECSRTTNTSGVSK